MQRILKRIVDTPDKQIVLAGFADSSGSRDGNCSLSLARADRVAKALATLGLSNAQTYGFCDELPVRDNGTDEGREENRRVEIMLR